MTNHHYLNSQKPAFFFFFPLYPSMGDRSSWGKEEKAEL